MHMNPFQSSMHGERAIKIGRLGEVTRGRTRRLSTSTCPLSPLSKKSDLH